jgi:DNA-directed RNA polymerase specialized sigma24 family protein
VTTEVDPDRHVAPGPDPAVMALDRELGERLDTCLGKCSRRCRDLFMLDIDEADTKTICRELRLSRSAVFTLRSRCLNELRELWWKHS